MRGVEGEPSSPGRLVFPWNSDSYISTGALFLSASTAAGEIESAILLCEPPAPGPDLLGSTPGTIASFLEKETLGPAFLARELARRFEARRRGKLLLIAAEAPETPPFGPATALAVGAFRGLGDGLFTASREASWSCYGIIEKSGKPELAARFGLRLLEEPKPSKAGRWLPFSGKPGLFGVL